MSYAGSVLRNAAPTCSANGRFPPPSSSELNNPIRPKPWIVITISTWATNSASRSDSAGRTLVDGRWSRMPSGWRTA